MKIYEFCPFFNENRVADIKVRENASWIDELHVVEANKTFSYADKPYNFNQAHVGPKVIYHPIQADHLFHKPNKHQLYFNPLTCKEVNFERWYWRLLSYNSAFHNEAYQRNMCTLLLRERVADNDVIILADFDEIIDSRWVDRIVTEVKRRQIITVKMHYSAFFLNLFCSSNHGAPHWSYRVFAMTGRYFKSMPFSSDYLRKKGIAEALRHEIYCLDEPAGFHHSWLDYQKNALPKLQAFAANVKDKSMVHADYIQQCLNDKKLYYLDSELYVDDQKPFLNALQHVQVEDLWYKIDTIVKAT
ncbi:hypothetical protein GK047_07270 [Paenibacillus sp. SYP-B3998]|uniref:Glycosyltransferase family 17 n=1 Tax=Paenibacillus sp. SYP-B3998 TaxID=2678564 RepID=A0A6G3ZWM3_9BACL|nr:hypothetical protein [Paenibacillus sp. SYP-B3998]NEW05817.1 hypothetical protein [Paenibacillus sp. SYP-B3998]